VHCYNVTRFSEERYHSIASSTAQNDPYHPSAFTFLPSFGVTISNDAREIMGKKVISRDTGVITKYILLNNKDYR